jgi:hypothetical protein
VFAAGLPPAPAPQKLPMPSGLLNRAAGGSSSMGGPSGRPAAAAATGSHMLPQQQYPWHYSTSPGYGSYQHVGQHYNSSAVDAYSNHGSNSYRPLQASHTASIQLPLPAALPLNALVPSRHGLPSPQQFFQQQQQQQRAYQVVRPVPPGYLAPGDGGSSVDGGGLQGLPYNPIRPPSPALAVAPPQTGAVTGSTAAVWGSGMPAGRPAYPGRM